MTDLRYPIEKFSLPGEITDSHRRQWIDTIAGTPAALRAAVVGLDDAQLDTPYRPEGWTVRQVVHHVADSHLNSYIRFRWALTEDQPLIKVYDQERWAGLPDARQAPVELSLHLLDSLHQRLVVLLNALSEEDFQRTFRHPEWGVLSLGQNLALYAWHGPHHVAHITSLRERMGW